MDYLQIIPLLSLVMYFFYLTYYYAAPMFCLKVLLFYAHIRYRDIDIRFTGGRITVKTQEREYERPIEVDPTSRFFAATVLEEFKGLLRDIRGSRIAVKGDGQDGLSAGQGTCGAGRQRTEEDCD